MFARLLQVLGTVTEASALKPRLHQRNMLLLVAVNKIVARTSIMLRATSNLLSATCCLLPATCCSSVQLVAAHVSSEKQFSFQTSTETVHWIEIETSRTVVGSEFQISGADARKLAYSFCIVLFWIAAPQDPHQAKMASHGTCWHGLTQSIRYYGRAVCRRTLYTNNKNKITK